MGFVIIRSLHGGLEVPQTEGLGSNLGTSLSGELPAFKFHTSDVHPLSSVCSLHISSRNTKF